MVRRLTTLVLSVLLVLPVLAGSAGAAPSTADVHFGGRVREGAPRPPGPAPP